MASPVCTNAAAGTRVVMVSPSRAAERLRSLRPSPSAAAVFRREGSRGAGNGFIELRTGFTAVHFGIDDRLLLRCARPWLSLRCAGADWSEPALVTVAEKLDAAAAARKTRAFAGAGGEEEKGRVEAI